MNAILLPQNERQASMKSAFQHLLFHPAFRTAEWRESRETHGKACSVGSRMDAMAEEQLTMTVPIAMLCAASSIHHSPLSQMDDCPTEAAACDTDPLSRPEDAITATPQHSMHKANCESWASNRGRPECAPLSHPHNRRTSCYLMLDTQELAGVYFCPRGFRSRAPLGGASLSRQLC